MWQGHACSNSIQHSYTKRFCKPAMIDQNDFLTLTGLDWGRARESQWVNNVDDDFVSFIAARHTTLEVPRLRCALDLFRSFNSSLARDIAHEYVNDLRSPIRGAARNVFTAHHAQGWISDIPQSDWQSNASLEPPQLTKRQRQRQRKYGQPYAHGEDRN